MDVKIQKIQHFALSRKNFLNLLGPCSKFSLVEHNLYSQLCLSFVLV
jgi:hypothetical protein